jgi:hypothetical protein
MAVHLVRIYDCGAVVEGWWILGLSMARFYTCKAFYRLQTE